MQNSRWKTMKFDLKIKRSPTINMLSIAYCKSLDLHFTLNTVQFFFDKEKCHRLL